MLSCSSKPRPGKRQIFVALVSHLSLHRVRQLRCFLMKIDYFYAFVSGMMIGLSTERILRRFRSNLYKLTFTHAMSRPRVLYTPLPAFTFGNHITMPGLLNMINLAHLDDHEIQQECPSSLSANGQHRETSIFRLIEEVKDQSSRMLQFSSAYRVSTHRGVSLPSYEELQYALSLQRNLLAAFQQLRTILTLEESGPDVCLECLACTIVVSHKCNIGQAYRTIEPTLSGPCAGMEVYYRRKDYL
ncbi:hypothetical protein ASPFODRAFT_75988 [Aspergillus luchuensis CBS 106.47]|uniref:Uncharacterized protein n=1 Tax=Aspergillus luchuensis (strain CBS 106.47) TaxID=1137211 RepID=A0A1M3T0H4_ASPLC|nr:hypothetical protein ASPFODRAFT_75988 [Aspergillus luchuensis CBS 106.47]